MNQLSQLYFCPCEVQERPPDSDLARQTSQLVWHDRVLTCSTTPCWTFWAVFFSSLLLLCIPGHQDTNNLQIPYKFRFVSSSVFHLVHITDAFGLLKSWIPRTLQTLSPGHGSPGRPWQLRSAASSRLSTSLFRHVTNC